MSTHEAVNAGLASFMKSSLVTPMTCSILIEVSIPLARRKSKINRVTTRAVNKLAATPIVRATPKPLIEPVPM
jgi:hypothetical protein